MLFHVSEHLKDLAFVQWRRLGVGGCKKEPLSFAVLLRSVACGEIVPPAMVSVLPFDRAPLWVIVCFFRAIDVREEVFLGSFGLDGRKISSVGSSS